MAGMLALRNHWALLFAGVAGGQDSRAAGQVGCQALVCGLHSNWHALFCCIACRGPTLLPWRPGNPQTPPFDTYTCTPPTPPPPFPDSPEVRDLTARLLPIFVLSLPGDGANATLQGLLRGSGRQETGAVTNLCSYWLLGIPAAAYFAFRRGGARLCVQQARRSCPCGALWTGEYQGRAGSRGGLAASMLRHSWRMPCSRPRLHILCSALPAGGTWASRACGGAWCWSTRCRCRGLAAHGMEWCSKHARPLVLEATSTVWGAAAAAAAPCPRFEPSRRTCPRTLQGTIMAIIALRFDFEKEARKAVARTAMGDGAHADAGAGFAEPLLMQGQQCERLEQGQLLAEPAGPAAHDSLVPDGPSRLLICQGQTC